MFQWKNLAEIVAHKDGQGGLGRFKGCLPDAEACDFDAQKEDFCASRANFLSSVDAVCAGKDGRVFFVEFKDEIERYRLGNLRRKAFDSLVIFWMTIGTSMSFVELCCRSVFVYVRPDGDLPDEDGDGQSAVFFEDAPELTPPVDRMGTPIDLQLAELKVKGLYSDVWTITAKEFKCRYDSAVGVTDERDFWSRIKSEVSFDRPNDREVALGDAGSELSLNRILTSRRADFQLPYVDFCADSVVGCDFIEMTRSLDEVRCPLSAGGGNRSKGLYKCDACQPVPEALYFYHNWDLQKQPFSTLVNKVFDGFVQWMLLFHAHECMDSFQARLKLVCIYEGQMPPAPTDDKIPIWQKAFWRRYLPFLTRVEKDEDGNALLFGLNRYVESSFYKDIKTLTIPEFHRHQEMKRLEVAG